MELQRQTEQRYKDSAQRIIIEDMKSDDEMYNFIKKGVTILTDWIATESYEKKDLMKTFLPEPQKIVEKVISVTIQIQEPQQITAVVGQIAPMLRIPDQYWGFKMAGEILSVLSEIDIYDIGKKRKNDPLTVKSCFTLPDTLLWEIGERKYLPPMICEPRKLTGNTSSGYLTVKRDSLILGHKSKHHEEDLCLDVLNKYNKVKLKLDQDMLKVFSEPPLDFDTPEKRAKWEAAHPKESWEEELQERKEHWEKMVKDSYRTYVELVRNGNQMYLTHKVDTRGRIYAQGYHVTTQGYSFKKAIIELAEEEYVEVPYK